MKTNLPENNGGNAKSDSTSRQDNLTKPIITKAFADLSKVAYEYLNTEQKNIQETYGIGGYENWYYDQRTGIITFDFLLFWMASF